MRITRAVQELKTAFPDMCRNGLAPMYDDDQAEDLAVIEADALRYPGQVHACVDWLARCEVVTAVNRDIDTYGYKHEVEAWAGRWVSHLSLLVAVQLAGIPLEINPGREYAALLPLGHGRPGSPGADV